MKADGEKPTARRTTPWQTVTEWHDPNLPPLETPETSSDEESVDESPMPQRRGRGLPPRMQEEIKKSLALVNCLMAYKLEDDPEMMEALKGRLGTAADPRQFVSTESPKRFSDINYLRGTLGPKRDVDFESFVNQDEGEGCFDGDLQTPVSPAREASLSVAQAFERRGDDGADVFGSDFGSPWGAEPADLLLHYQGTTSDDSDWELEEETSSSIHTPYQQTYSPDPRPSGNWATQLYQIDEKPREDECDGEPSADLGEADGDWYVNDLQSLIKIEGSLDMIKNHVGNYVNEGDDFGC